MFVAFVTLVVILCGVGETGGRLATRRCCSPPVWEADVEATGAIFRSKYEDMKVKSRFSFDYPARRWAFSRVVPGNDTANTRLVYDHKEGMKYAINGTGCFKTPLAGKMFRHCADQNATFDGQFTLGYGDRKLEYCLWSYEILGMPMRSVSAYTRNCLPLQDSYYSLVQQTWAWEAGDPPCVPWQEPLRVHPYNNCYKCHVKLDRKWFSTQITSHYSTMAYRNIRKKVSDFMFEVGDQCTQVKEFTNEIFTFTDTWKLLITKMKYF